MGQRTDPARSYEAIDDADLARLGRTADADLHAFFARNPHLAGWRDRVRIIALAQGAAEHRLRSRRGIWDLDLIVGFAAATTLRHRPFLRRIPTSSDWGPSKLGRCPSAPRRSRPAVPRRAQSRSTRLDGRAVDVMLWVIPNRPNPVEALREWLSGRAAKHRNPARKPDVANEPIILIRPRLGQIAWDPGIPPPARPKTAGHRKPQGVAPP
jgi:hypothetical protein